MGDGDDRSSAFLFHAFNFALDEFFRGVIQRRGGLIQDQDFGVAQKDTGQGNALPLPARKIRAALRQHEIVAARQLFNVGSNVGFAGRFLYLGRRDSLLQSIADVMVHGIGDQKRGLGNQSYVLSQHPAGQSLQRCTAQDDFALSPLQLVHDFDQGGFTAAAGTCHADEFPAINAQVNVFQYTLVRFFGIAELHPAQLHLVADRGGNGHPRRFLIGKVQRKFQQAEIVIRQHHALRKFIQNPMQFSQWSCQLGEA